MAIAVLCGSLTAQAAPIDDLLRQLEGRAGSYRMVRNDEADNCRGVYDFKIGDELRVVVKVQATKENFLRVGDAVVSLQQFYPSDRSFDDAFGLPVFGPVNQGPRKVTDEWGAVSWQNVIYQHDSGLLRQTRSFTERGQTVTQVQEIHFVEGNRLLYRAWNRRQVGSTVIDDIGLGSCEFKK